MSEARRRPDVIGVYERVAFGIGREALVAGTHEATVVTGFGVLFSRHKEGERINPLDAQLHLTEEGYSSAPVGGTHFNHVAQLDAWCAEVGTADPSAYITDGFYFSQPPETFSPSIISQANSQA
jgi:hypothetical protein